MSASASRAEGPVGRSCGRWAGRQALVLLAGLLLLAAGCRSHVRAPHLLLAWVAAAAPHERLPLEAALEGLAQQGVSFTRAYQPTVAHDEAAASLLTARYPSSLPHSATYPVQLTETVATLPRVLHSHGYHTAAFCAGRSAPEVLGFGRGQDAVTRWSGPQAGEQAVRAALGWLAEGPGEPRLATLWAGDVPCAQALQEVLTAVRADAGISLVVVVGAPAAQRGSPSAPAGWGSQEELLLRVPLIFAGAGVVSAGRRIDEVVQTLDVLPTVLALADLPPLAGVQGRDLAPTLRAGVPPPAGRVALADLGREGVVALDATHLLRVRGASPGTRALLDLLEREAPRPPHFELYALGAETSAARPAAGEVALDAARQHLHRALLTWQSQVVAASVPAHRPRVSPKLREELRRHGYWN